MSVLDDLPDNTHLFDARAIGHRFRHSAIFGALDSLQAGEGMRFINDHDPIPLLGQMAQRYGGLVDVNYIQRGQGGVVIDFRILAPAID